MTAIAWAIVVAACIIMPRRDKKDEDFYANNWFDFLIFYFAMLMLLFWSFK